MTTQRIQEILKQYKRYPYGTDENPHISGEDATAQLERLMVEERMSFANEVLKDAKLVAHRCCGIHLELVNQRNALQSQLNKEGE